MRNDRHFAFVDGHGQVWTWTGRGTEQEARQAARRRGGRIIAGPCPDVFRLSRQVDEWRMRESAKEAMACAR